MDLYFLALSEIGNKSPAELPEQILLAKYGKNEYTKAGARGFFEFSESDADRVIAEFERRALEIPIDYEHLSLYGEEAPAAGWINKLIKTPEGLIGIIKELTTKAQNYIKEKEYKYYSPAFKKIGQKIGWLHSVGLTNKPAFDALQSFKDNQSKQQKEDRMKDIILKALGLEAFSEKTDEEIQTAATNKINEMASGIKKTSDFLSLHGVETLEAFTEKVKGLVPVEEKTALETELKKRDAEKVVTLAMSEGKVTEAMKNWAEGLATKDIEAFSDWAKVAPKVVPDGEGTKQKKQDEETTLALTEDQKKICRMTGVSEDDYKKTLKELK